jgi:hypothetical protein
MHSINPLQGVVFNEEKSFHRCPGYFVWKVTEVKVRHIPTNRIGAVNAILPNESLNLGFPKQPLLADRAIIRWIDGQGQNRSDELDIPYDAAAAKAERTLSLTYILLPSGSVTAHLQDSSLLNY